MSLLQALKESVSALASAWGVTGDGGPVRTQLAVLQAVLASKVAVSIICNAFVNNLKFQNDVMDYERVVVAAEMAKDLDISAARKRNDVNMRLLGTLLTNPTPRDPTNVQIVLISICNLSRASIYAPPTFEHRQVLFFEKGVEGVSTPDWFAIQSARAYDVPPLPELRPLSDINTYMNALESLLELSIWDNDASTAFGSIVGGGAADKVDTNAWTGSRIRPILYVRVFSRPFDDTKSNIDAFTKAILDEAFRAREVMAAQKEHVESSSAAIKGDENGATEA
ncbi:hypothetical protein BJ742DRAFT_813508, partial [Cladochytrium replicatum]